MTENEESKTPPISLVILGVTIIFIIFIGSLYLMSWSYYNSDKQQTDQCRICVQKHNLNCTEEPALGNIYSKFNNINTTYFDCSNDVKTSQYCKMCFPSMIT